MGEEFKPSLEIIKGFDGKMKADYNEFTNYLSLTLAYNNKAVSFHGNIPDQKELDNVLINMTTLLDWKKPEKLKE